MGEGEQPLHRDPIGAGGLAGTGAGPARVRPVRGQGRVFGHGVFFPSLGMEVMAVAHDRIDGDARGALGFAQAAGVPAVQLPEGGRVAVELVRGLKGFDTPDPA